MKDIFSEWLLVFIISTDADYYWNSQTALPQLIFFSGQGGWATIYSQNSLAI